MKQEFLGFTLIELILLMPIAGFVAAILFSVFMGLLGSTLEEFNNWMEK